MNPFERLRQTIDKVNIVYQFQENEPVRDSPSSQAPTSFSPPVQSVRPIQSSDPEEVSRMREQFSSTQTAHIQQITALAGKLQQSNKALRRAEAAVQSQLQELVAVQKENELLKANLNEQYRTIAAHDERERKLKEEVYRLNVTLNELAAEINAERTNKKQLLREQQAAKTDLGRSAETLREQLKHVEGQRDRAKAQLEERVAMFEYNVKKNAEDRNEYKAHIARLQENYDNTLRSYRIEVDKLKQELYEARKQAEIAELRRQTAQEERSRNEKSLKEQRDKAARLQQELQSVSRRLEESLRAKEALEQSNSSLGSSLQEERKNIKIKVVEVRDQTLLLELDMYKRQCKELMQEKAIANSLRSERSLDPAYRIVDNK